MLSNQIDRMGVGLVVGMTVIGYFGGIRPLFEHHADRLITQRAIADKTAKLSGMRSARDEAEARVVALDGQVRAFREGFTASPLANERIGEVAELAQVMGVAVDSMTPGEAVENGAFRLRPITISGRGTPDSIARLLAELRGVFPDMGAKSFSVGSDGSGSATLSAELVWFTGRADDADRAEGFGG